MDYRNRASSDFSSGIVSESGCTGFVEVLIWLQAEAAGDDLFPGLGGAAETRLDAAELPELTIVAESTGLVLPPVQAVSIESARAAASARCLFVPKPGSGANCQRRSIPGLGQAVRGRLPVSAAAGSDLLTWLPGHPGAGVRERLLKHPVSAVRSPIPGVSGSRTGALRPYSTDAGRGC